MPLKCTGVGGLAVIFVPLANIVCLVKHWMRVRNGFLLGLIGLPFLVGAYFLMPTNTLPKSAQVETGKVNDPFYAAMQRAKSAVAKVQESRKETSVVIPVAMATGSGNTGMGESATATPPAPVLSLGERLANNRAAFKALESDFAALNAKRQRLPKNDSRAIGAFNLEAKSYSDKLLETRSEQSILLELQRTAK